MAALAHLLLDGYSEAQSIDPTQWTDYYWVVGIEGWTPSNTRNVVFSTLPTVGSAHPDATRGAIVSEHRVVEKIPRPAGTYPDGPGGSGVTYTVNTDEAVVAVTWSSRRPFSLFNPRDGDDRSEFERVRVPGYTAVTPGQADTLYVQTSLHISRPVLYRTRTINATGIDNGERTFLELMLGALVYFPFPSEPQGAAFRPDEHTLWVLSGVRIYRNRFNQDILEYQFMTKGRVVAQTGYANVVPALDFLEEWDDTLVQQTTTNPPDPVPVRTPVQIYGGVPVGQNPLNYNNLPRV